MALPMRTIRSQALLWRVTSTRRLIRTVYIKKLFHYLRNTLFILLIFIYILFEELIWNTAVKPIIQYIAAFHFYHRFLYYVRFRAGRFSVLILFMIPFAIGEVIGTASAFMAAQLHLISAALLYTVKIPLIVIALGILQSGKEKLLTFGWFAVCYLWIVAQIEKLHSTRLYQQTLSSITSIRNRFFGRSSHLKRWFIHTYRHLRCMFIKNIP